MDLLQLKYFRHAAECENFSKTAKEFGVPPSDISQSIKRLEKELACSLFNRRANSVTLNDRGRSFYTQISKALSIIEDAAHQAADDGISGQMRLGININRRVVMQAVEKFRRLYPGVDIVIKHGVRSNHTDFDIMITAEDMSGKGFSGEKLFSEDILLAVRKDHPLAAKEDITAAELKDLPFISMSSGENLYTLTEEIGRRMGFEPHIAIQSDDPFYIRRCVELGLGAAFVPAVSWKGQFSDGVTLKSIGRHRRTTYACINTDRYVSGCCRRFLELLREECR